MSYFADCLTLDDLRAAYRTLALQHHPDRGGNTKTMQAINAAYTEATERILKGEVSAGSRTEGSARYQTDLNEKLRAKLEELLAVPGIEVEICGLWFWLSGDTKPVKEQLKALGCRWAPKKKQWFYPGVPSRNRKEQEMQDIRDAHGSVKVRRDLKKLAA